MIVPNQAPLCDPGEVRLAVVGECPGLEEENWRTCSRGHTFSGRRWQRGELVDITNCPACASTSHSATPSPFRGPSGRLLDDCLLRADHSRPRCFVGNISRTPKKAEELNNPSQLAWDLPDLAAELAQFKPNCVLLLGNAALRAFHPLHWDSPKGPPTPAEEDLFGATPQKATKRKGEFILRIGDWRGSIFEGHLYNTTWRGKCVAAYHPAAILHSGGKQEGPGANPEFLPLLRFDVKRAVKEAKNPSLDLPHRDFSTGLSVEEIVRFLQRLREQKARVAFDIEGYATTGVTDCSFATSPESATWIPFQKVDGSPWWTPSDEQLIKAALKSVLEDPGVSKVMHNAGYEMFVMQWAHGMTIRGVAGDTMLAWHEFQPELDKALDVPASILTRQAYWKHLREEAANDQERAFYNCTDSCVTLELEAAILPLLSPGQRSHYEFNLTLLEPMSSMMLKGIRFDAAARAQLVTNINREILELQGELDGLAGIQMPTLAQVAKEVCFSRHLEHVTDWPDVVKLAKPTWKKPAEENQPEPQPDDVPF